jgi:hypothetical protein
MSDEGAISSGSFGLGCRRRLRCRAIVEHARTARVGAAAYATELAHHERVGSALHHRDHESRESVADRNEATREGPVTARLEATGAGAASKDPVDLRERVDARLLDDIAAFGQSAKRGAHTARIHEGGRRARRLLLRPPPKPGGPFRIHDVRGLEPLHERLEFTERIEPDAAPNVVGVDEVQPQPLANEDERRVLTARVRCARRVGKSRVQALF